MALARALAPAPRVLLLDEPLGALDRPLHDRLVSELHALFAEIHQTAVYVTHDVAEAFALAESLGMEPVAEAGGLPVPAPPLRLDGERPAVRRPPPALDEHGAELRAWLEAD